MRRPAATSRTRALAYAGVVVALAAAFCIAPGMAVALAPAALLLLLLVHGLFPGEEAIERLRGRMQVRAVRPVRSSRRPALPQVVRRTGREIAFALAVRPPPAGVAISS